MIKYFYSQVMNIFVEELGKKLRVNFFSNKTKTKTFLENRGHLFKIFSKIFQIWNFQHNSFDLGQIELLEVSRPLQNWAQLESNLHDNNPNFFTKNIQWQHLEYKLWENKIFCWVVGNIMSQIKRFKNTSKVFVNTKFGKVH